MASGMRTIGFKLVMIITALMLVSLAAITLLVSVMVSGDVRITAENNNLNVNKRSAAEAEAAFNTVRSNTLALLGTVSALAGLPGGLPVSRRAAEVFFEQNQNVAAIVSPDSGGNNDLPESLINRRFFLTNDLDPGLIEGFIASQEDAAARCRQGELLVLNAAPVFGLPVLAMLCPYYGESSGENSQGAAVFIFFSTEDLTGTFGAGVNLSCLIADGGELLIHSDAELINQGADWSDVPFIKTLWERPERSLQILYTGNDGERYFGAFQKLTVIPAAVVTNVEYSLVFEGVAATTRRNIYLTGAVLFLAILFVWFFSKTISGPLKNLAQASRLIEKGQFDVQLTPKTRDEIGLLTHSFVAMSRGLAERERLKETFGRFINKEIAERALKGELSLGGENKRVTIFFSDIRSFTAMSEKLQPGEVVAFLNEYMTAMVDCVEQTNGVVDKFIGDAIMAVWGAPLSSGSAARDALNCVRSAIMMRIALKEFNRGRGGDKKPVIKIGCGINTGDVVAGQIGSSSRMEYTVIGDAVNLASRTEALNKPFATDILITENTYKLIGKYLITEEMPQATVKGKEKPVRIYAVINLRAPEGPQPKPETLEELRKILGLPRPDPGLINSYQDEKKYKIGN
ncbi:MAG: HAMP domain-containing protein [Spirochaetales bacterium]|nr:HAMP domain-containing protein [Spirochaetales bacterium]